jgi:hypothetical protein
VGLYGIAWIMVEYYQQQSQDHMFTRRTTNYIREGMFVKLALYDIVTWRKDYKIYASIKPDYIQINIKHRANNNRTIFWLPKDLISIIKFGILF